MENLEEDLTCDPRYLETKIPPALHGNCNSWSFQSSQKCACPLSAALFAGLRAADDSAMLILANTKNSKKCWFSSLCLDLGVFLGRVT